MMRRGLCLTILCHLALCLTVSCAVSGRQTAKTKSVNPHAEYTFGVEFALDYVVSSIHLKNGSNFGLAKITGDNAYQSLMRSYLETCDQIYHTRTPVPVSDELQRSWDDAHHAQQVRQDRLVREPELSWWDSFIVRVLRRPSYAAEVFEKDVFTGDVEVDVLTRAVASLKDEATKQMSQRFGITESLDWAFASILVPDFFWTTIDPATEPRDFPHDFDWDGWIRSSNVAGRWRVHTLEKFAMSLHRNKYRLDVANEFQAIFASSTETYDIISTSPSLPYEPGDMCMLRWGTGPLDPRCQPEAQYLTSIIINFSNASTTLWLTGPFAHPWNTFPELGGHSLAGCEEDACINAHWDTVIEKLEALTPTEDSYGRPVEVMDLVLTGESWSEASHTQFRERMASRGMYALLRILNVYEQDNIYAASMSAAKWARSHLGDPDAHSRSRVPWFQRMSEREL